MNIDYFLTQLKTTLDDYFNIGTTPTRWAVAALEREDYYIIKAQMQAESTEIAEDEIPARFRRLIIWTFADGGRVAWIRLDKPLDFAGFAARLMVSNLFGQGLVAEQERTGRE